jgi:hypothetical protein
MSMKHKIQHLRTVSRKLQQITQDMLIFRGKFLYPDTLSLMRYKTTAKTAQLKGTEITEHECIMTNSWHAELRYTYSNSTVETKHMEP